ncbi:MAG: hypothetical protein DRP70_07625 [Spirochaetes bacterium]|nr:MAG: hypothetical protein DRP70_07625 [Spirochaetota bacterium]
MKSFTPLAILTVLFFSVMPLFSQSEAAISYAEGNGFQLIRNGQSTSYDILKGDVIGLPIQIGDMVLTDKNSFVEIQLNSGDGGVIKLAEDTTFTVTSLDGNGGGVFKLIFGRIRVKVAALTGGSRLWVSGYDTVAGVRGTDFGYDLFYDIADEGGERQTSVYCFEGAVDVLQYDKKTVSKIDLMALEPFILDAGKMVKTRSTAPNAKLKSGKIDKDISAYWSAYPIITTVGGGTEKLEVSEELNLDSSLDTVKGTYETGGKIVFAAGVGMMTIGGLLRAFLPDNETANGLSTGLLAIGGASVLAGGGMMIYSFTLP